MQFGEDDEFRRVGTGSAPSMLPRDCAVVSSRQGLAGTWTLQGLFQFQILE
jgi:hypothetical protein